MAAPSTPKLALAALALVSVVVAGCANDNGSPTPGTTSAGPSGSAATTPAGSSSPGESGLPSGSGAASGAPGQTQPLTGNAGLGASGPAAELQQQFVSIVAKVNPSVVVIESSQGLGSGVVFDDKGDIVTNAHVAGTGRSFTVTTADGKSLKGTLVGVFAPDDVAVIRVSGGRVPPAAFGDSSALRVGDIVLAIGNPLGLQSSVTEGIVSATGRTVSEPTGSSIPNMIQTSAAINPGNSGGALVNLAGEVIGIPTLAASDPQMGGSAPGIGFAVSSNMATDIARQLITSGKVTNSHRAYLGVQLSDVQQGGGALVVDVVPNGPASKAGVEPGDFITSADGQAITAASELTDLLATMQPGQTLDLEIETQSGSHKTAHVTLGEFPAG